MRCTTIVAIATLVLASCKVVEIDKQPIKTTYDGTQTVRVDNLPPPGGTSNVKVTNKDDDPVPVKLTTSAATAPILVRPTVKREIPFTNAGVVKANDQVVIVEYINCFWTSPTSGAGAVVTVAVTGGNHPYYFQLPVHTNTGQAVVSEKVFVVLTKNQELRVTAAGTAGFNYIASGRALYEVFDPNNPK
jgi:hypothetical protein